MENAYCPQCGSTVVGTGGIIHEINCPTVACISFGSPGLGTRMVPISTGKPFCCPVCNGWGKRNVPNPASTVMENWVSCVPCGGTGIVWGH